jgi:hypothetical protein
MIWLQNFVAALALSVMIAAGTPAHASQQASPDDTARFLAGLNPSAQSPLVALTQDRGWQQHADALNTVWAGLDAQQLSKIRAWSQTNLTARKPVTYYPFSGPDFLYADAFFPNSSTYVLAGLEQIGQLPDVLKLRARTVTGELGKIRSSLSTLLSRSYFITSEMGTDLSASQLRGTLPLLYVFLARTGKTIHEVNFVELTSDGTEQPVSDAKGNTRGVKITFSGSDAKPRTLYYFRTDLSNRGIQASGFLQFCAKLGIGDVFIKAASYLLHNQAFATLRDFLLGHGATIVQDDTGIPVKHFQQAGWDVRPFGHYVGPIPTFRGNYQSKLKDLFAQNNAQPIAFGIGYRWRLNQSHVLLATNKNPGATPVSLPATQAKQTAPRKKSPPPLRAVAQEPSRFDHWRSLLMGGLITNALVSAFGLEFLANALGFVLQTAAIGGIVWLIASLARNRGLPHSDEPTTSPSGRV